MQKLTIVLLLLVSGQGVRAQLTESASELEPASLPYRPRIAEITFNNLYDYSMNSTSSAYGEASSKIQRDKQMKIRLGVPIIMKDKKMFGVQFKYDKHNFVLDRDLNASAYELYDHLESKNFTSLGARALYQVELTEDKKLSFIAGAELKSDQIQWQLNTTKYYAHAGYEVKINKNSKIGAGLAIAYTLKTPQIYPLVSYEHHFNKQWTMDLYLPKKVSFRYKVNERFYITASTEVKGWRYAYKEKDFYDNETVTLRKSDIFSGLSFEHELHDWLWFSLDAGYAVNLRSYVAKVGDRRRDAIVDMKAGNAPYARFGIFIVPPKKFYYKH